MTKKSIDSHLLWQCHRGMLELDLILQYFVRHGYSDLNQEQQDVFQDLLVTSDPVLMSWLLGASIPDDPLLAAMVDHIRCLYSSRLEERRA